MKKVLLTLFFGFSIVLQSGCWGVVAAGAGAGGGMWVAGDLEISSNKPVDQVMAAIEKTCGDLEFKIDTRKVRPLRGLIVADGDFGRVTFIAKTKSVDLTDISIRVGAIGDKDAQDFIYKELKPKL
tara:strand:+ start:654 stop:1031 length:378 start_codon:yes stop_codon:yes gene_type:complete